jgi:signal transduction histidine kinase
LAELKYDKLTNELDALATDVTAWSRLEVMNDLISGDIDKRVARALQELKRLYGLNGELYAFDAKGDLVASSRLTRAGAPELSLPSVWRTERPGPALLGKQADPITGAPIIALKIPINASFDPAYRIGTLVLSYPWSGIERLLFSGGGGTVLIETGDPPKILAVDPPVIARRLEIKGGEVVANPSLLAGWSAARAGMLGDWRVQALQETGDVTRLLGWVGVELLVLGGALAAPIMALGRWLSNRVTAPVMALTQAVREIADTDRLDARVPVSSSDELGALARSFNRMAENLQRATREREQVVRDLESLNQTLEAKVAERTEELEAAIQTQHRLIGDISHEIKSPLARLDVALGLARRSAADQSVFKQFDRMEREIGNISALASELLTLARLDSAPMAVGFETLDLGELVAEIVADARFEAPHRQADILLRAPEPPVLANGNAELLRRAIENVVRNALFYTTENTRVTITVASKGAERAMIEVRDHGPGVPEQALAHLFEPFYRVDAARARKTGGAGIGLTICQRVVALHGGTVGAWANWPNGLIVRIEIATARDAG